MQKKSYNNGPWSGILLQGNAKGWVSEREKSLFKGGVVSSLGWPFTWSAPVLRVRDGVLGRGRGIWGISREGFVTH